jgi:hypothetical protein
MRAEGIMSNVGFLLFVACGLLLADPVRAQVQVRFEVPGQFCLSGVERDNLVAWLRTHQPQPGAAITLVAYSDRHDIVKPGWHGTADCVGQQVSTSLVGHGRIALLRALAVAEAARRAGLGTFTQVKVLALTEQVDTRSHDPRVVTILTRRSQGGAPEDRRVELHFSPAARSPESGGPVGVTGPVALHLLQPAVSLSAAAEEALARRLAALEEGQRGRARRRLAGWITLALGLSAAGVMAPAFSGAAVAQNQAAARVPDARLAVEYESQSSHYWIAGAVAGGVGLGLTAVGAALWSRSREPRRARPVTVSPHPGGLALSY